MMDIYNDILEKVDFKNNPIKNVCLGLYSVLVENQKTAGLSSTLHFKCSNQTSKHISIKNAGQLEKLKPLELCEYIKMDKVIEKAIGIAACNSYHTLQENDYTELNAADLIATKSVRKKLGVIGHFPFLKKLESIVDKLYIFELFPEAENDISADKIPELLPECDVVAITGTSFSNNSFNSIMTYCKTDAYKIVLGPSTPLFKILFDYGIDALCGSIVVNPEIALPYVSQAVPFKFIKGIKHITVCK